MSQWGYWATRLPGLEVPESVDIERIPQLRQAHSHVDIVPRRHQNFARALGRLPAAALLVEGLGGDIFLWRAAREVRLVEDDEFPITLPLQSETHAVDGTVG